MWRMKNEKGCILCFVLFFATYITLAAAVAATTFFDVKKSDFPPGFIFGAGTSASQVEGAAFEDGRKPSIWDTFSHSNMTQDHSNGDVSADQYHKYKEDVKLMRDMGLDAYRFSISWSRLIPDGRGPVNPKGLQYYNNLIDTLVSYGIEPHVTLYHLDLPQALQDEYEGLTSPRIIEDYTAYANACFKEFGDRVKNWITFNEPNLDPVGGYDQGIYPPQRCSRPYGLINCTKGGDSTKEPYIVAHHILLAHLSASTLYKEKYKAAQGGNIGITIAAFWFEPVSSSKRDIAAVNRVLDFHIGWIMNPLVYGDYPTVMKKRAGLRLPSFNTDDSNKLKFSFDFIGITHYDTHYVLSRPNNFKDDERDYTRDVSAIVSGLLSRRKRKASTLGYKRQHNTSTDPYSLERVLNYFKVKYKNPPIVIHENGFGEYDIVAGMDGTNDEGRVKFLQEYIKSTLKSIRRGSNTRGYFVWSFLDSFELELGYTARFGLIGVEFNREDRRRYHKLSARWYAKFLKGEQLKTNASNSIYIV